MEIFHSLRKDKVFWATGDQHTVDAWAGNWIDDPCQIVLWRKAGKNKTISISSTWSKIPAWPANMPAYPTKVNKDHLAGIQTEQPQVQPPQPPCPPPAVANLCCFNLTASKYSQKECEQLCLEVNSFLAPASNCLKPWDMRFDYNHSLHMFRACLGQDRLSSPLSPMKGGWELAESHRPQSQRGPQRLTISGFLFLG